ncbi:hypothetical protein N7467_003317 [Penicillium canescens]|nr:hypothetical protein N7467_003317 [Penicillium canescens]
MLNTMPKSFVGINRAFWYLLAYAWQAPTLTIHAGRVGDQPELTPSLGMLALPAAECALTHFSSLEARLIARFGLVRDFC